MTERLRFLLIVSLLGLSVVMGAGCEKPHEYGEFVIRGRVVDAETAAPIEHASVYVTAYPLPPEWLQKRHVECYTDANGEFELWYDTDHLRLFEVEKQGYVPASQTLEGSGQLFFALEKPRPAREAGSQ